MELLKPVPIEKWPLLRDTLKREWPTYAYSYIWMNNMIKWKRLNPDFEEQIFCPNGDHESGVFVSISKFSVYMVTIFAFNESRDVLRKILGETKIIDWSEYILFAGVHENFRNIFLDFMANEGRMKNIELTLDNETKCYFKTKEECAKVEVNIPEECELKYLDSSHISTIHAIWPHRSAKRPDLSFKFLESGVIYNRGIGLFLKKDNSLISWILHDFYGGLGMLQTLDGHKGKGYAKIVVKAISKELAMEENIDTVLFIVGKNITSQKLFKSLGYVYLLTATWFHKWLYSLSYIWSQIENDIFFFSMYEY